MWVSFGRHLRGTAVVFTIALAATLFHRRSTAQGAMWRWAGMAATCRFGAWRSKRRFSEPKAASQICEPLSLYGLWILARVFCLSQHIPIATSLTTCASSSSPQGWLGGLAPHHRACLPSLGGREQRRHRHCHAGAAPPAGAGWYSTAQAIPIRPLRRQAAADGSLVGRDQNHGAGSGAWRWVLLHNLQLQDNTQLFSLGGGRSSESPLLCSL